MPIIFKCKSSEAYHIKILAELLANNLKTGCFQINEDGIMLTLMDYNRATLIDLNLQSENFSLYKFKSDKELYIGINLNHFHRMLKSIKKKDKIEIYIDDSSPTDLAIKAIPKENTRVTTSFVKIQNIQNIDIDVPTGYGKPVIVLSSEFQKTLKDMLSIGQQIRVCAGAFSIKFICNAGGVLKRMVEFGEVEEDDSDSDEDDNKVRYDEEFSTEQLIRITKIAGLGTTMQIFPAPGLPLLFRSCVGSLGKISIYIKSNEQIKQEQAMNKDCVEDSDSDSD